MNKQPGFTLIELMIVIAIIGIIAAIAYPNYQENIAKSRRADAKGALTSLATAMERHFTEVGNYCDVGGSAVTANCGDATKNDTGAATIFPAPEGTKDYYTLTINTVTPNTYIIYAAPIATSLQAKDKCGSLTLTNTGVRDIINKPSGSTATAADCW